MRFLGRQWEEVLGVATLQPLDSGLDLPQRGVQSLTPEGSGRPFRGSAPGTGLQHSGQTTVETLLDFQAGTGSLPVLLGSAASLSSVLFIIKFFIGHLNVHVTMKERLLFRVRKKDEV